MHMACTADGGSAMCSSTISRDAMHNCLPAASAAFLPLSVRARRQLITGRYKQSSLAHKLARTLQEL